jgi:hypothetical protein
VDDSPLHKTTETPGINTTRRTTTRYPSTLYKQTADKVLNVLKKVYRERNKRAQAIDEMRTLKIGRRPFDDF